VIHKSTYPANAPSEDRSTLVIGDGFLFGGVWDGHGGVATSNYAETAIYEFFKENFDKTQGASVEESFKYAYKQTDDTYLATAKKNNDAAALFAGTCAVGAFIDFSTNTVCCSNLGDSRCVVGLYEGGTLQTINMSEDHAACHAREKKRVQDEHPRDPTALVQMSEDDDD
jgi:serine/threonine protein phosphatase PrpC